MTIVTTAGRPDASSERLAQEASEALGYPIVERRKRSIARLQREYGAAVLVAGADRYELYRPGMEKPFFFHPNSAAFRLKRLLKEDKDPLVETAQLRAGDSFLDCTLGLASDSIIAAFVCGAEGKVKGVEADRDIAFITSRGLHSFPSASQTLTEAMRRIYVEQMEAVEFLRDEPDASWDVVYMDPMFSEPVTESSNFTPLRQVGIQNVLTDEWIEQARRVCKRRVVIKDRFDSPVFEKFGFERFVRPNTKFHFGYLNK